MPALPKVLGVAVASYVSDAGAPQGCSGSLCLKKACSKMKPLKTVSFGQAVREVSAETRRVRTRNARPIAPTRSSTSEDDVRLPCATADSASAMAPTRQTRKTVLVNPRAQKLSALLPAPAILALVQHDRSHMRKRHETLKLWQPPRASRPWMFENPWNFVSLENTDQPQGSSHAAIAFGN
jgi:hypothetical protein